MNINIKKLLFVLVSALILNTSFAQNWIFDVTLNFRPIQWMKFNTSDLNDNTNGLFHNSASFNEKPFYKHSETTFFEFTSGANKAGAVPIRQFIRRTNMLFFEGEIMFGLYQLPNKIKLGLGWCTNQGAIHAGAISNGTVNGLSPDINVVSLYQSSFVFRSNQYYTFINKKIGKNKALIHHNFTLGFGVDVPASLNPIASTFIVPTSLENHNGNEVVVTPLIRHFWASMLFKYEFELRNKKDQNILGINITYNQGLNKVYQKSVTASMTDGRTFTSFSESRGSGLRLGISKSFSFKKEPKIPVQ